MVERNGESNLVWSRVQGKPIEVFNGDVNKIERVNSPESLLQAVLKNKGFDSLVQMYLEKDNPRKIPVDILKEIVLVDSLDVDPVSKTKVVIYRVWAQDGHYSRIKEYFPETSFGLEQIQTTMSGRSSFSRTKSLEEYVNEVMMDEGELGRNYNIIHYRANLINKLLPRTTGLSYIRKFELLAKIINEVSVNSSKEKIFREAIEQVTSKYEREVVGLENRLRSETRLEKAKRQKEKNTEENNQQEDSLLMQVEFLLKDGFTDKVILETTGISKNKLNIYRSVLRIKGRLEVYPSRKKAYEELTVFISAVEDLINRNQGVQFSNREIAEALNSSPNRVQYARQILVVLGKIPRSDLKMANMRRSNTFENFSKIKKTLLKFKKKYPGRTITLEELQRTSGAPVSLDTISEYLKLISNNENIPIRSNSLERAKAILIDESRSNQGMPLDFRFLEKKYRISREYFTRGYEQIKNSNQDTFSHADYYKSKKEKLIQILNNHLVNYPNAPIDLTIVAGNLGLHPGTVYKWYWDFNKTQQVPKSNSNSSKIPKKNF